VPVIDVKKDFDKGRLIALAEQEGLAIAPGRIQCPYRCSEDKRGANVSPDGLWHCKHCDRGGSAIDLVMATRNLAIDEAADHLRARAGTLPTAAPARPPPDVPALWRALAAEDPSGLEYLRLRGLDGAVAAGAVRFSVGKSGNSWLDHKSAEGYRIAVPLFSLTGTLTTFQLRTIMPGADPRAAKQSLAGVTYPAGGVAFGLIGQAKQAQRVFVSEGMADTLALLVAGVTVVGAPGVDQVKKLGGFLGDVAGRTVILCPQNDAPRVAAGAKVRLTSEQAFRELEAQLVAAGADVVVVRTPAPHKDPADWLRAVGKDAFRHALDEHQPDEEPGAGSVTTIGSGALVLALPARDPRPRIIVRTDEHEVAEEAVAALASDDRVYQRDGVLVHVSRDAAPRGEVLDRKPNAPRIAPLPRAVLRERLAARAKWVKVLKSKGKVVPEHPPDWAVQAVHARGTWPGVRYLSGIVEAPVLRADGSVLEVPGYDARTGLLFEPSGPFLPVPEQPTHADARAAAGELLAAVQDFPFERDEHQSAWLAALLTPLARFAFEGPAPLFLIDANTRGSGKSKLADLVSVVVSGRDMPRMAPEQREEEWRKRITSIAMCADPLVLIDNVVGSLGSPALDGALTGTVLFDRAMGGNATVTAKLSSVWFATGNNVQLKGDLFRRTLHVRLESKHEKPEERDDFLRPDLLGWARAERPRLLRAALTILRAHHLAGRPTDGMKNWGSFEAWSRTIRGAIAWLGLPDPYITRERLQEAADGDAQLLAQLLSAWEAHCGTEGRTLTQLLREFNNDELAARSMRTSVEHPPLYDVFCELAPPTSGGLNIRTLAARMKAFRGRVFDGRSLEVRLDRTQTTIWRVVRQGAGSAGSAGSVYSEARQEITSHQPSLFSPSSTKTEPAEPAEPADLRTP
jgi:hypothetical protein